MENKKLNELKALIRNHLNECDNVNLPTICEMKSTKEGYEKLEQNVINRIGEQGLTLGQALIQIEKEYNINTLND